MQDHELKEKTSLLAELQRQTPARIGVSRGGPRPLTKTWLKFRMDHALARDAVSSELSEDFLNRFAGPENIPVIESTAHNRKDFILYPPRGKRTEEEVLANLQELCPMGRDVQIVISDGLSAFAVEENLADLYPMLTLGFDLHGISYGRPIIVKYGRVAIADQLAHALQAKVALNLIGERPGLSTASSLSAYITYNPGPATISSDRTVVSNIHAKGTPAPEAGAFIVKTIARILEKKVSGVNLQKLG